MTYEGYKGPSDPNSQYGPSHDYQPLSYSSYPPDSARPRSRASSTARSDVSSQRPLYDTSAVSNAFDRFDKGEAAGAQQVDPNLIAQITEQVRKQVIDSLKSGEIPKGPAAPQSHAPPVRSPTGSTAGLSSAGPPPSREVYTPPSPSKNGYSSNGSNSPEMSTRSSTFEDVGEMPTPRVEKRNSMHSTTSTGPERTKSQSRPPPATRASTDGEATTVEKIWQPLFNPDGKATARLGQFVRGVAIHLIEDYEPKKSLVVTPTKLTKFYEDVALPDEIFPWARIFSLSNSTLCKIYRDLRCEHYLIQDAPEKVPCIPALTPAGFQTWMTILIQAHPDLEYKRLSKAVLDMPISNADNPKERFPKELSRRLFPREDNLQAQQHCAAALSAEGRIPVPRGTAFPPPPPPNFQQPAHVGSFERERSPYHGTAQADASSAVTDSEDETPLASSVQIERERKPYTGREGSGRIYAEDHPLYHTRADTFPESSSSRHQRSHSSATSASAGAPAPQQNFPPSAAHNYRHSRRDSRRQRSPSFSAGAGYGTRSDGSVGDIPTGYYSSNLHSAGPGTVPPPPPSAPPSTAGPSSMPGAYDPLFSADDPEPRRRADWARRQAEEEEAAAAAGMRRSTSQSVGGGAYPPPLPRDREEEYYRNRGGSMNGYGYERDRYGGGGGGGRY